MTSTRTTVGTHTHTATHLADVILSSIAGILATLKIDPTQMFADWNRDQSAIQNWIEEGSLKTVVLECHRPHGGVHPVFEFPISYGASGIGDRQFTTDRAAWATYLAKLENVPVGTGYRLFCSFRKEHTPQPGWGPGKRASVNGLRSSSFGTLASGPHANAGMRYYRK